MKMGFKRRVAGFLAAVFACSALVFSPSVALATPDKGFDDVGRMVAAEGIVMLQNPDLDPDYPDPAANVTGKVLPIEKGENVSIFGRTILHYYNGGTGSGGDVKMQDYEVDNFLAGLRSNPKVTVNEDLVTEYIDWVQSDPANAYNSGALGGWNPEPFGQKEMPVTAAVAEEAAEVSDTAIVIIGRTAGEDHDMPAGGDDLNPANMGYELSNREKNMIKEAYAAFDRVVIVMNCANIMDMSWAKDYPNAAILYTWTGGQKGGYAIADVLTGDVTPSGKLSDTMAESLADYYPRGTTPDGKVQFGDWNQAYYGEDIYVGYRYFETFADAYDKVLYPFGFGLSYTTFDMTTTGVTNTDEDIIVDVTVKNTGLVKGKEVVQVYYAAPQGTLGNPAKELAAFAKTKVLYPGESQNLKLSFKISEMASYNEATAAYELLAGDYDIFVGNCVRAGEPWGTTNEKKFTYTVAATEIAKQLTTVMPPVKAFDRIKPGTEDANGRFSLISEAVPTMTQAAAQQRIDGLRAAEIAKLGQYQPDATAAGTKLIDVYNGEVSMTDYINSLSRADLSAIVIAPGMSPTSVPAGGSAGVFGGVTTGRSQEGGSDLKNGRGVPPITLADGPSGLRMQSSGNTVDGVNYAAQGLTRYATNFASGTAIACTWNIELAELLAQYWGKELKNNYIDVVLGPGINIHRFPLNGRNFEYFSEDPLLTGAFGAAFVRGVQSQGPVPTIKHYAGNNQETGRHQSDSIVSERALREIYLKSFQIAVEDGGARSVMTSYNPINGLWSANNPDLSTTLLRNEWGFQGVVMTDWWPTMNSVVGSGGSGNTNTTYMVRAQNDIYAVADGGSGNSQVTGTSHGNRYQEVYDAYTEADTGQITRKELSRSARNILEFAMATPAFARNNQFDFDVNFANADSDIAAQIKYVAPAPADRRFYSDAVAGDPLLSGIAVGDRAIVTFHELALDYHAYWSELSAELKPYPTVTATAKEGSVIKSITQPTKTMPVAVIVAEQNGSERVYRVALTPAGGNILADGVPATLTDIKLNGETISGFDPAVTNYSINWTGAEVPEIKVTLSPDCELRVDHTNNGDGTFTIGDGAYDDETGVITIIVESTDEITTYQVRLANAPKSDDFNTDELSKFWVIQAENDDKWSLGAAPGNLRVTADQGDVYQTGGNAMKNIFYQYGYGDWEAVAKFNLNHLPNAAFNGFGLMVFDDLDNYTWFDYEFNNTTAAIGGRTIGLVQEKNAVYSAVDRLTQGTDAAELNAAIGTATTVWMKMIKEGDTYTGAVSIDGVNYTTFESATNVYAEPKIGITVYNGTAAAVPPTFYADIEYVHFNPREMNGSVSDIYDGITLKPGELKPVALSVPSVTTEASGDVDGGLAYVSQAPGEAADYSVNVKVPGTYTITARAKTNTNELGAQMDINLFLDGTPLDVFGVGATDSQWETFTTENVTLPAGEHTLNLAFTRPGIRLNTLTFDGPALTLDLSDLTEALESAPTAQGTYPDPKWAAYLPILEKAQAIAETPLSQEQVDLMAEELLAAIEKLISGLPSFIEPDMTSTVQNGTRTDRVYFKDLPWMWAQSADARFEGTGENSNIGYTTVGDTYYLGYVDTTGLKEIKVNYSNGNLGADEWQPSQKIDFYTAITETGDMSKASTHAASSIAYDDLYRGGSLSFNNYFAGLNFRHDRYAQNWGSYGVASTTGDENAADRHPLMVNYWEVGTKTFLNPEMIGGWQNVYMNLSEGSGNFRYVEFIYDTAAVTYDWGYEEAPAAPAAKNINLGATLGAMPEPDFIRPGYIFGGWETAEGVSVTAETIVGGNMALTAVWTAYEPLVIDAADNEATLTATLVSEGEAVENAMLLLALYNDDGILLSVQMTTVDFDGESITMKTLSSELPADAAIVKGFLWEAGFTPLLPAVEANIE